MELDDEEIRATKKIGKNEMTREEAIQIILKERYQYIVPGSRLDLALEILMKEI